MKLVLDVVLFLWFLGWPQAKILTLYWITSFGIGKVELGYNLIVAFSTTIFRREVAHIAPNLPILFKNFISRTKYWTYCWHHFMKTFLEKHFKNNDWLQQQQFWQNKFSSSAPIESRHFIFKCRSLSCGRFNQNLSFFVQKWRLFDLKFQSRFFLQNGKRTYVPPFVYCLH